MYYADPGVSPYAFVGNDPLNRYDARGLLDGSKLKPLPVPDLHNGYNWNDDWNGDFNSSWDSIYGPANGAIPYYSGSTISFLSNNPGYIKRSAKIKRVRVKDEVVEEPMKLVWENGVQVIHFSETYPTYHIEYRVEDVNNGGDALENGLSFMLSAGGLYSGINEFSKVRSGRWFSAAMGKWYKMGYYGRTDLTLQSEVLLSAKGFRLAGRVFGAMGVGFGIVAIYSANSEKEKGDAILDTGMSVVGLLGPVGMGISASYFIIDSTIGWNSVIMTNERVINKNKQILGESWRPWR